MKRLALILIFVFAFAGIAAAAQEHATPSPAAHDAPHGTKQAVDEHATAPAGEHGVEEHHGPKTYRNTGIPMWILNLINMILFFGILIYLVRKPIGNAFAQRREEINSKLAEAEARRAKADQLVADIDARLKQIEGEVGSIMERAREEGERQKRELMVAAEEEAKRIVASARTEADTRLKAAREELTAYARELATQRAQQLIEKNVTDEDRKRLFNESVGQISEVRS